MPWTCKKTNRDAALQKAIDSVGSVAELARRLHLNRQAVSQWRRIPPGRAAMIEKITGISRAELRPDLWGVSSSEEAPQ